MTTIEIYKLWGARENSMFGEVVAQLEKNTGAKARVPMPGSNVLVENFQTARTGMSDV